MAKKYIEAEDTNTRRKGQMIGGLVIIAPTTGPKNLQAPGDLARPFEGGGRAADLPADWDQRAAADDDWKIQLARNARQDRQAIGIPKELDGTPWLRSNRER